MTGLPASPPWLQGGCRGRLRGGTTRLRLHGSPRAQAAAAAACVPRWCRWLAHCGSDYGLNRSQRYSLQLGLALTRPAGWREQSPRPLWRRSVRQALSIGPSRGVNMLSDCVANSSRGPCAAPKSRGYKPRFVGSLDALDFVAAETVHQVRRYGHKTVGKRRAWVSRCGLAPRAHTRSARRFPARTLVNRWTDIERAAQAVIPLTSIIGAVG